MKKIVDYMIVAFVMLFALQSCSNDDEPKQELTAEYLEATTWDAQLSGSAYPNHTPITAHFIMQFLSLKSGKCIPAYDDDSYEGSFTYSITKNMITFNGAFVGNWTVIERTKNKMVLQAFMPNEFIMVLTRK